MWLYFNQNGRLLEVSEYDGQARAGTTAFKIFAVFENINIDTEYTQATLKLYKPDSNGGSYPIILMEKEDSVTFDGPNGIHFVRGQSYKCYSFDFSDLQSGGSPVVLLDTPGLWYAVITLRDARKINVVGSSSFNVQDGISSETDEMEAFDAILDYFYRNYGGFVPYTGATNDLDLGSHALKAGTVGVYYNGTTWCGGFGAASDGKLYIENNNAIVLEAPAYYIDSVSTNNKIATQGYVDNSTKLYKHIVQVADYGHNDYVKLIIISKSGNAIQDLNELGDYIQGFVNGFYADEHDLIYPLLECGVNLTAFGFAFIDENHEFFDATWSNALVSTDIVEEI